MTGVHDAFKVARKTPNPMVVGRFAVFIRVRPLLQRVQSLQTVEEEELSVTQTLIVNPQENVKTTSVLGTQAALF